MSCLWNRTVCSLLYVASFASHSALRSSLSHLVWHLVPQTLSGRTAVIHCESVVPFCGRLVFHCVDLFYWASLHQLMDLIFGYYEECRQEHSSTGLRVDISFHFPWIDRSGIAGSGGKFMFDFLKKLPKCFPQWLLCLHSPQQCVRVSIFPCPH